MPGIQTAPVVAGSSDSDYVIAWSGSGCGDPHGVYARILTPVSFPQDNTAPIAEQDSYSLLEDQALVTGETAGVLANDTDIE